MTSQIESYISYVWIRTIVSLSQVDRPHPHQHHYHAGHPHWTAVSGTYWRKTPPSHYYSGSHRSPWNNPPPAYSDVAAAFPSHCAAAPASDTPPAVPPPGSDSRTRSHTNTDTCRAIQTAAHRRPPATSHSGPCSSSGGRPAPRCPCRSWYAHTGRSVRTLADDSAAGRWRSDRSPARQAHKLNRTSESTSSTTFKVNNSTHTVNLVQLLFTKSPTRFQYQLRTVAESEEEHSLRSEADTLQMSQLVGQHLGNAIEMPNQPVVGMPRVLVVVHANDAAAAMNVQICNRSKRLDVSICMGHGYEYTNALFTSNSTHGVKHPSRQPCTMTATFPFGGEQFVAVLFDAIDWLWKNTGSELWWTQIWIFSKHVRFELSIHSLFVVVHEVDELFVRATDRLDCNDKIRAQHDQNKKFFGGHRCGCVSEGVSELFRALDKFGQARESTVNRSTTPGQIEKYTR